MLGTERLLPVVNKLLDAATHDGGWKSFLGALSDCFESEGAQIVRVHPSDTALTFSALLGYDRYLVDRYANGQLSHLDKAVARYAEEFVRLMPTDPRIALLERYPSRPISCRLELAEQDIHNSRAYQELLGPANVEYSLVVNLPEEDGSSIMMGVFRGKGRKYFTQADANLFGALIPFVKKTIAISETLARTQFVKEQALDAVDAWPCGLIILSQHQQIVHANAAARAILLDADGLRQTVHDSLVLDGKETQDRLRTALSSFCLMGHSPCGAQYEALAINRPSGRTSYEALLTRVQHGPLHQGITRYSQPLCLLFVSDPDVGVEAPAELIRRLYGLTLAQARICELLVAGHSLEEAATMLNITRETARSHLKRIFENMGVNRQSELIQKICSSPLWLTRGRVNGRAVVPPK